MSKDTNEHGAEPFEQ